MRTRFYIYRHLVTWTLFLVVLAISPKGYAEGGDDSPDPPETEEPTETPESAETAETADSTPVAPVTTHATTVTLSADLLKPALDDVVTVTLRVRGPMNHDHDLTPGFHNLKMIYSQHPLPTHQLVDGESISTREWRYYLLPQGVGAARVDPVEIKGANDAIFSTEGLTLEVVAPTDAPPISASQAMAAMESDDDTLVLRLAPDQETIFVGQRLVITGRVFAGTEGKAVVDRVLKPISVTGVSVARVEQDATSKPSTTAEASITVVPEEAGALRVGAMSTLVTIEKSDGAHAVVLRSAPFVVQVNAPPEGAPEGFTKENIGLFRLDERLDGPDGKPARKVTTGAPLIQTITVNGLRDVGEVKVVLDLEGTHFAVTARPLTEGQKAPTSNMLKHNVVELML